MGLNLQWIKADEKKVRKKNHANLEKSYLKTLLQYYCYHQVAIQTLAFINRLYSFSKQSIYPADLSTLKIWDQ